MSKEGVVTTQINIRDTESAAERAVDYYERSLSYLNGPLAGTCHFGYTEPGEPFKLETALRSMEMLLGQTIALPPGSKVLDAGCGYGRVAATLSEKFGYDVIGIDLIQERLKEAHRYTGNRGDSEKVNLVRGNYQALPLKDSSVDAVFTMETLVHADPLEAALDEFGRVLKPGGRLVLFEYSVPDLASLGPILKPILGPMLNGITDNMVKRTGMFSIKRFTHGSFPALLQKANFEYVTVKDISRNVSPTWQGLFWTAIHEEETWSKTMQGQLMKKENTNLAGSLLIWPYRHQLGYNVVTATKPDIQS